MCTREASPLCVCACTTIRMCVNARIHTRARILDECLARVYALLAQVRSALLYTAYIRETAEYGIFFDETLRRTSANNNARRRFPLRIIAYCRRFDDRTIPLPYTRDARETRVPRCLGGRLGDPSVPKRHTIDLSLD